MLTGSVVDRQTQARLPTAHLVVQDEQGKVVKAVPTTGGAYAVELPGSATYQLVARCEGYEEFEQTIVLGETKPGLNVIPLTPLAPELKVFGTLNDTDNKSPIAGIKLTLKDLETQEEQEQTTGADGKYQFELQSYKEYELAIRKRKFFNQVVTFNTKTPDQKAIEVAPAIEEIIIGKGIKLDDIYYASGKWDIQPQAARELNKLVKMLIDNPTVEIELSSHTDARGSSTSNASLSERRAQSAMDYVVSKGISARRITSRGYGEAKLINRCADGVECSADEHQQNRRTEFAVTKY